MLLILKHQRKVGKLQKDKEGTEDNVVMKQKLARERLMLIYVTEITENSFLTFFLPMSTPHPTPPENLLLPTPYLKQGKLDLPVSQNSVGHTIHFNYFVKASFKVLVIQ